ncbi:MAG: RNA-guided endonuclease IscB [Candidatus Diapherotrites archaeon]
MLAYVLNRHGEPLMPCGPRKARLLLKEGKARVVLRAPFTIQLLHGSSGYRQPVFGGRDPGLTQGVTAVRQDGGLLFQAEAKCRPDISEKLEERRGYRRSRRGRKTRYREPRFDNRARPGGWVPPSIRQLKHEHDKLCSLVESILPITAWAAELNKFDFQKMENPGIQGVQYQNGPRKGYFDVREYVLERDGYACVLCNGTGNRKLFRLRGKSNRPKNLVTLCGDCHERASRGEIALPALFQSYRWAARVNVMRALWTFSERLVPVSAEQAAGSREALGLQKSHVNDALAVVHAAFGIVPKPGGAGLFRGRFVRAKNRQLHRANPAKGGKRPNASANRYLVSKSSVRIAKYDLVEYRSHEKHVVGYVNTLRTKGTVRIADAFGKQLAGGVSVGRLRKLQNASTLIWEVKRRFPAAP